MDEKQAGLLERIERKLDQHGISARDASIKVTGKPDLIRDLRRAKGLPRADRLDDLAGLLGTTSEWLLRGGEEREAERRADEARGTVLSEVAGAGLVGTRDMTREWRGEAPLPALPLLGTASGGSLGEIEDDVELVELHLGEVLEYLTRPASLASDSDAYALTVLNESMAPKFEPKDRVAVSPRAPVSIGDYVIVQLCGDDEERIRMVLIKRLVRRTATEIELHQYNPETTFRIPRDRVKRIHKVVGTLF